MAAMMNPQLAQQQQPVYPKQPVGFDSITRQIEKKLLKRGFQFNVICVGMSCSFKHLSYPSAITANLCC